MAFVVGWGAHICDWPRLNLTSLGPCYRICTVLVPVFVLYMTCIQSKCKAEVRFRPAKIPGTKSPWHLTFSWCSLAFSFYYITATVRPIKDLIYQVAHKHSIWVMQKPQKDIHSHWRSCLNKQRAVTPYFDEPRFKSRPEDQQSMTWDFLFPIPSMQIWIS
jgi:hypothetical protein